LRPSQAHQDRAASTEEVTELAKLRAAASALDDPTLLGEVEILDKVAAAAAAATTTAAATPQLAVVYDTAEVSAVVSDSRLGVPSNQAGGSSLQKALLGLFVVATAIVLLVRLLQRGRASPTPLRQQVEQLREVSGAEIRSMFGLDGEGGGQTCSPGILTRIHGEVVAKPGAALTALLVCRLADLDLQRALGSRGRSKIVPAQFLQGFVDGALEVKRHLVWQQLFSIEDDEEAARVCEQSLQGGFFACCAPGNA